jgi:hypothetical protein
MTLPKDALPDAAIGFVQALDIGLESMVNGIAILRDGENQALGFYSAMIALIASYRRK